MSSDMSSSDVSSTSDASSANTCADATDTPRIRWLPVNTITKRQIGKDQHGTWHVRTPAAPKQIPLKKRRPRGRPPTKAIPVVTSPPPRPYGDLRSSLRCNETLPAHLPGEPAPVVATVVSTPSMPRIIHHDDPTFAVANTSPIILPTPTLHTTTPDVATIHCPWNVAKHHWPDPMELDTAVRLLRQCLKAEVRFVFQ